MGFDLRSSVSGIRGDGAITLTCALIGLAALGMGSEAFRPGQRRRLMLIISGIGAGITALVGLVDMNGAAAIGLYLTMLAGIAWLIAVVWDARTAPIATAPN